jgi:hypothetical protein
MHAVLPGYPDAVDPAKASTMQDQMTALAEFQTKIRTVRVAPRNQRMQLAQQLIAADGSPPTTYSVALALSALLRDSARTSDDWKIVLAFLRGLPDKYRLTPELRELGAFAGSQAGNTTESIAELQTLIESFGPTPERLGLLGGRYKRLSNSDTLSAGEKAVALSQSIDAYERGMNLDLNQYYCSCNLPRLYRLRGDDGDEQRAQNVGQVVIAACERARQQSLADPWLRPTLLATAFDAGDIEKAEQLARQVAIDGPAAWQIESLLRDLEVNVRVVKDDATRARFVAVFEKLRRLLA